MPPDPQNNEEAGQGLRSLDKWIRIHATTPTRIRAEAASCFSGMTILMGVAGLVIVLIAYINSPGAVWLWSIPSILLPIIGITTTVMARRAVASESAGLDKGLDLEQMYRYASKGALPLLFAPDTARVLNEAAGQVLQARVAFASEPWRLVAKDSVSGEVRDNTIRALDSAMAKLVVLIDSGLDPCSDNARQMVERIASAADEAVKTAAQQAHSVDPLAELSQAETEMRSLRQAHVELSEEQEIQLGPSPTQNP